MKIELKQKRNLEKSFEIKTSLEINFFRRSRRSVGTVDHLRLSRHMMLVRRIRILSRIWRTRAGQQRVLGPHRWAAAQSRHVIWRGGRRGRRLLRQKGPAAAGRERRVSKAEIRQRRKCPTSEPTVGVIFLAEPSSETARCSGALVMIHREQVVAAALVDAGVNGVELVAWLTRVE